jgi:hypothetical protein
MLAKLESATPFCRRFVEERVEPLLCLNPREHHQFSGNLVDYFDSRPEFARNQSRRALDVLSDVHEFTNSSIERRNIYSTFRRVKSMDALRKDGAAGGDDIALRKLDSWIETAVSPEAGQEDFAELAPALALFFAYLFPLKDVSAPTPLVRFSFRRSQIARRRSSSGSWIA